MSKTAEQIRQELDQNIPREVISTRSGGGGKALSYLEAWYVIDRLNQVLGTDNWCHEIRDITLLPGDKPTYRCVVRLTVNFDGKAIFKDGIGYGIDKSTLNPHETAVKEAESDAIKRAARTLGRSLGLALYDKSQEYVSDTISAQKEPSHPLAPVPLTEKKSKEAPTPKQDYTAIRSSLRHSARILNDKKVITLDDFKKKYKFDKVDNLSDPEVVALYDAVKRDFSKELQIN